MSLSPKQFFDSIVDDIPRSALSCFGSKFMLLVDIDATSVLSLRFVCSAVGMGISGAVLSVGAFIGCWASLVRTPAATEKPLVLISAVNSCNLLDLELCDVALIYKCETGSSVYNRIV